MGLNHIKLVLMWCTGNRVGRVGAILRVRRFGSILP